MNRLNRYSYEVHEDPFPVSRHVRDDAPCDRNATLQFCALRGSAPVPICVR